MMELTLDGIMYIKQKIIFSSSDIFFFEKLTNKKKPEADNVYWQMKLTQKNCFLLTRLICLWIN